MIEHSITVEEGFITPPESPGLGIVVNEALALMLVVHLTMVHQQGLADPTADSAEIDLPETAGKKKKLLPFFPNYVLDEVIAWYAMLALLIILASVFPGGLEEPAANAPQVRRVGRHTARGRVTERDFADGPAGAISVL